MIELKYPTGASTYLTAEDMEMLSDGIAEVSAALGAALGNTAGVAYKLSGFSVSGGNIGAGYVLLDGKVYHFPGAAGTADTQLYIQTTSYSRDDDGGGSSTVRTIKRLTTSSVGSGIGKVKDLATLRVQQDVQDTGWVAVSYASGFSAPTSGQPLKVRRIGNVVYMKGGLKRGATSDILVCSLPEWARPELDAYVSRTIKLGPGFGNRSVEITIPGNGNCSFTVFTDSVSVDPIEYDDGQLFSGYSYIGK